MTDPAVLPGLMMRSPLGISAIATRAEDQFGTREVVSRTAHGIDRLDYRTLVERARRLASSLREMGIGPGDRVGTFAWNSARHLELYLAVPSLGAVLHTINIRLHQGEISYIIEHAGDRVVFADASVRGSLPNVAPVQVTMPDADRELGSDVAYEELIASGDPHFEFPEVPEEAAAALCYTSGTTGRPKGVLYSHRSLALYALMANQPDAFGVAEDDTVMAVVPMFHANAWGLPYIAALAGAKQVLPGPSPTPAILAELIASERVTMSAAVPTVWQGVRDLEPPADLTSIRELIAGGSAVPESLIRQYAERGVKMVQGWGMTETSPLALVSRVPRLRPLGGDEEFEVRAMQGRPIPFVEARIDDTSGGELQVKGPTVAEGYFQQPDASPATDDGWMRTGDIAVIDDFGYVKLTDRTKDLIKSGGEWISSVELETAILFHPDIVEAAVVAMPDATWGERPCMFATVRPGADPDLAEVRAFLAERLPSWALPDRLVVVPEIPKTSVGKLDKKLLRSQLDR
jgi:fatty-acyl-CoA synthase